MNFRFWNIMKAARAAQGLFGGNIHFDLSATVALVAALDYNEAGGGTHLADRFEEEVRICIAAIKAGPTRFGFYRESDRFRRIRMQSFP